MNNEEMKLVLDIVSKLGYEARFVFVVWCLKELAHIPAILISIYWIVRFGKFAIEQTMLSRKIKYAAGYISSSDAPLDFERYIISKASEWRERKTI